MEYVEHALVEGALGSHQNGPGAQLGLAPDGHHRVLRSSLVSDFQSHWISGLGVLGDDEVAGFPLRQRLAEGSLGRTLDSLALASIEPWNPKGLKRHYYYYYLSLFLSEWVERIGRAA